MLAFLAARGVPVVVLAAAAAADALAAAAGGTFAPALTARFGGTQLAGSVGFQAALMKRVFLQSAHYPGAQAVSQ